VAKRFAYDNYNHFITNKDAKELGVDLFQDVVTGYATRSATPVSPEPEPKDTMLEDFRSIYEKMIFPDGTALCAKGERLGFHKALLASHSDAFASMFRDKDNPEQGWDFKRLTSDAFRAMQRNLYYGEQDIAPLLACELVAFGRDHDLNDLVRHSKVILQHNVNRETCMEILKKCCLPHLADSYKDVTQNAIDFAATHLPQLDLTELRNLEPAEGHYISCELLLRYQQIKKNGGAIAPVGSSGGIKKEDSSSPSNSAQAPLVAPPSLSTPPIDKTKKDKDKKDKKDKKQE